ncbi:MAG: aminotransferase class V-fold PLP-dependent enzyme [Planctomycetes bacterium]|nr:aminotransferase class V-fold PLP-dependent enzyme [Planctomycetota bacterium]
MDATRRTFLGALAAPLATPAVVLRHGRRHRPTCGEVLAELDRGPTDPRAAAHDEDFWQTVAAAFTVDRSLINLNNGGVSPAPAVVQAAQRRHLEEANHAPAYVMWRLQQPGKEAVRQALARIAGCEAEEVALTRNASEGLQTCQFGFDLEAGDEVLCTDQDYPRMLNTFRQRAARDGIVLKTVKIPVPCEDPGEIVRRYRDGLTDRTRLILCCHVINLTGQILPVRELAALGRERGIPVIVDGAHSFAHVDFRIPDLECDYFATSLHKWLFAPIGTGLLFVRRERIPGLWPLMAANTGQEADIRKFEEIGTCPIGNYLAIADAALFHERLGTARKQERLLFLRDLWARRLGEHERVRLNTSLAPGMANGIANVRIDGIDSNELAVHLQRAHRIIVTTIRHEDFEGIRVSPSVYTTPGELERFCEAMETVAHEGLPD